MKTSEKQNKFANFTQQKTNFDRNRPDPYQDLNEERIITTYKPRDKIYYFDNSAISLSYGQYNVEKCLFVLSAIILITAFLIYNYYTFFNNVIYVVLVSGGILDVIAIFMYLYFLAKLKSEQIFNRIPMGAMNMSDILISLNFIVKIVLLIMILCNYSIFGITAIILFILKFLAEFYFTLISVKFLMLCPCSVYIQEASEKLWTNIKYYLFCCEVEEPENPDYTKIEDVESIY